MRETDLRETFEWGAMGGDTPRVVVIRYWSAEDIDRLVQLAQAQATTRQIALELGRTPQAVRLKASRMGLALTAHEVRRSAKRHAKRQGKVAAAEVKNLRKRPRVAITVDFDLSSLTRHERRQLAERLREMDMEEPGVTSAVAQATDAPASDSPATHAPSTVPPATDAPLAAARRPLRIPEPYNPSAATSARHREANAKRSANRESLGWNRKREIDADDDDVELRALTRQAIREARRRARSGNAARRVSLDLLDGEMARTDDPLDRLELESAMQDPQIRARLEAIEDAEDAMARPPYERPVEDEYARYRRYLREK